MINCQQDAVDILNLFRSNGGIEPSSANATTSVEISIEGGSPVKISMNGVTYNALQKLAGNEEQATVPDETTETGSDIDTETAGQTDNPATETHTEETRTEETRTEEPT